MKQADPPAYAERVQQMAQGGDMEHVYVNGKTVRQAMDDNGITLSDIEKSVPGISRELANALDGNTSMRIPIGPFAAHMSGLNNGNFASDLVPHIKLDPEGWTLAEAQEYERRLAEYQKQGEPAANERQPEDDAAQPDTGKKKKEADQNDRETHDRERTKLEKEAEDARQLHDKLVKLNELAKNSQLRQSDPAEFSRQMQEIMGTDSGKGFFVKPWALWHVLEQNGTSYDNLKSLNPAFARDLLISIYSDKVINVPMDFFAEHLAGKMDKLLPHARVSPDAPSLAETLASAGKQPANAFRQPDPAIVERMQHLHKVDNEATTLDCSEVAESLLEFAGKGKILHVIAGRIKHESDNWMRWKNNDYMRWTDKGKMEENFLYHDVYTDGNFVYDPILSATPVTLESWKKAIRYLNPQAIIK
jgi:hypothetical protein